jgi:hypothetical protein
MTRRILAAAAAVGVLMLGAGCAALREENRIHDATREYTYPQPGWKVWPSVMSYVTAKGYSYKTHPTQLALVTEWKEAFHGSRVASSYSRLLVQVRPGPNASSSVQILEQTVFTGGKGRPTMAEDTQPEVLANANAGAEGDPRGMRRVVSRNLAMEWELLQQLQPQDAQALAARARAQE